MQAALTLEIKENDSHEILANYFFPKYLIEDDQSVDYVSELDPERPNMDNISKFSTQYFSLLNAGEALHLEVRIRPSPSLQTTPVRVLKIVPEYPNVITFLKYSALLNWSLFLSMLESHAMSS